MGSLMVFRQRRQRQGSAHHGSLARSAPHAEGAAENFDALAHNRQPEMAVGDYCMQLAQRKLKSNLAWLARDASGLRTCTVTA